MSSTESVSGEASPVAERHFEVAPAPSNSVRVFTGCTYIEDYEKLDKVGQGTFGFVV